MRPEADVPRPADVRSADTEQASRRARVWRALRVVVLLGVIHVVLSYVLSLMLFHPSREVGRDVERVGGERVRYATRDGVRLVSWLVPSRGPRRRTVVYFHGNAGVASGCWGWAEWLALRGSDVLLAEYRGYGESEGSPTAAGIELDAEAAIRYLVEERHVPLRELVVHGQSLGGAAAMVALTGPARDAAGGVLESTFTSLHDMGRAVIGVPLTYVVPDAYHLNSAARAPELRAPILQLHGDRDETIPFSQGERLRDLVHPRRFVRVPGGNHNLVDPWVDEEITRFVEEVAP
jgi:fermentation-respiration switch protein FrsA (DUF1100 family)